MIMSEKKLGEEIRRRAGAILPAVPLFVSAFIAPGNEWAAAASSLPLAVVYSKEGWERLDLFWWGVGTTIIAALLNDNGLAVGGFWLLVSGIASLAIARFRRVWDERAAS